MEINIVKKDWLFLISCLSLAIIAELSFLHGEVGIAYIIFMTTFFTVYYIRFKGNFKNKQMGALIITCIFLITGSYAVYDKVVFSVFNLVVVTGLSLLVVVLMVAPKNITWQTPVILKRVLIKLTDGINYSYEFMIKAFQLLFKNVNPEKSKVMKQIGLALVLGVPLLAVIIVLLMSADQVFEEYMSILPTFFVNVDVAEITFRVMFVIVVMFGIFGVFQRLTSRNPVLDSQQPATEEQKYWGTAFGCTILVLINIVYILFTIVQFKYFFSGHLHIDFTYAEYARRGFFELLTVTIINWTILVAFLKKIDLKNNPMRIPMKVMYSILILVSAIMLISAFQRLTMYEIAYGFTIDRVQAHVVMLFLFVVFAYTFIHVWLEGLRLTHFYFIVGLLFFTGMNVVHVEKFIAEKNWERYEATAEIDVHYLSYLSSAGMDVLLRVYEDNPNYPELDEAVESMRDWDEYGENQSWQSFNISKYMMNKKIDKIDFTNE